MRTILLKIFVDWCKLGNTFKCEIVDFSMDIQSPFTTGQYKNIAITINLIPTCFIEEANRAANKLHLLHSKSTAHKIFTVLEENKTVKAIWIISPLSMILTSAGKHLEHQRSERIQQRLGPILATELQVWDHVEWEETGRGRICIIHHYHKLPPG